GTLVDIPRLFRDKAFRHACLKRVADEEVIGEFRAYDNLRPAEQAKEVEAVINRLGRVLRSAAFRQILGSKKTTVPFEDVLSGEIMLVVSLPSETLSADRCNFMGSMLLCGLAERLFARKANAVRQLRRVHLYLDEYQRFATKTTAELLTQGRKFGAGVTLAHQDLQQIKDPEIRNASLQARSKLVFTVTRPDAELLAGEFPRKPRPDRTEILEDIDGTEPDEVISPTPGRDLMTKVHANPTLNDAANMLICYADPVKWRGRLPHLDPSRADWRF